MRGYAPALSALIIVAAPALARELTLGPPLDCEPAAGCFIQQYVDTDPGSGSADFMCGTLSYDGHKGTDFALPSVSVMERGVDVLAAASGTVRGVRDGMADIAVGAEQTPDFGGRECGNGVVLTHENGWETQYCHLRKDSVRVIEGQTVDRGTILGQVGLSGQTAFPHLHLSVRKNGDVIDPFNPQSTRACGDIDAKTLWTDAPRYEAGGLIAAGFSDGIPEYGDVKAGTAGKGVISPSSDALVVWAYAFGAQSGDVIRLSISGPNGPILTEDVALEKTQAQLFRAIGKRATEGNWPTGSYDGRATMIRDGTELDQIRATVTIER